MAKKKGNPDEKHVTVLKPVHDKIKELAKWQHRSMRGVINVLVEEEHAREKKKRGE